MKDFVKMYGIYDQLLSIKYFCPHAIGLNESCD